MKHSGRNLTSLGYFLRAQTRPVTYLDSNAVSDLARLRPEASKIQGIEQVRRDLCSFASKRTIVLGQWFFSELAFLEDHERRQDFVSDMTFVNELQFFLMVRSSGEVIRSEMDAFHAGHLPDPFMNIERPIDFDNPKWRNVWAEERQLLERDKIVFLSEEAAGSKRVDDSYPDKKERAQRLAADWATDPEGIIRRWVREQLKKRYAHGRRRLPPAKVVRTLWCHWAYLITRTMRIEVAGASKNDDGDFVDLCHYQTGAHATEFVTSDKRFMNIATQCPPPKPEILSLKEWVARLRTE